MQTFENGTNSKTGKLSVIDLHGTWREMGRQYGALMSDELRGLSDRVRMCFLPDDTSRQKAAEAAEKFIANFPFRLKEVIAGMSETSGLRIEELKLLNAAEIISLPYYPSVHGSAIAVWGDYAEGSLILGRNYDSCEWLKDFDDYIVLSCFHPADGALSVAAIGYAGEICAVNAMNEKGLFLELNNGMPSGGSLRYENRIPAVAELFTFLLDSETLDELESCFQTVKTDFAYVIGAADGQTARAFEWPVFDVKRRTTRSRPGLTVLTNHFTEFSWGLPRPEDKDSWQSRTRRRNLLNLAKHFKGTINEKVMMDIMDTKIEDLGATTSSTLYQLVVVPERYELWFKIPDAQDWTLIDMKALLEPR